VPPPWPCYDEVLPDDWRCSGHTVPYCRTQTSLFRTYCPVLSNTNEPASSNCVSSSRNWNGKPRCRCRASGTSGPPCSDDGRRSSLKSRRLHPARGCWPPTSAQGRWPERMRPEARRAHRGTLLPGQPGGSGRRPGRGSPPRSAQGFHYRFLPRDRGRRPRRRRHPAHRCHPHPRRACPVPEAGRILPDGGPGRGASGTGTRSGAGGRRRHHRGEQSRPAYVRGEARNFAPARRPHPGKCGPGERERHRFCGRHPQAR